MLDTDAARLSEAKRALLQQYLRGDVPRSPVDPHAITPRAAVGPLPLSFPQQRLWFLDQLQPGNPAYNLPATIWLRGALDIEALGRSLDEIVRRHEILRTRFAMIDGQPAQIVAPHAVVPLPTVDLRGLTLTADEREVEVRRLVAEEARRPFDLARGPVLRAVLPRLGADLHVLLLTIHHIAFDGWSIGVLLKELTTLYDVFSRGLPSPLPELPIQYGDVAYWQRRQARDGALDEQVAYWRGQLDGAPVTLALPTDRPRPAVQTFRGARGELSLRQPLAGEVRRMSRQEGVTLFTTLLAAFELLLYRYTGQDDIVIGLPVAGRTRTETEGLIGFFVNTLALRVDLSDRPSFLRLLARVREATVAVQERQEVPFERLVAELQPERTLSHTPLFQIMFNFSRTEGHVALPALTVDASWSLEHAATVDLTLYAEEQDDDIRLALVYNTDLFDGATIERMLDHARTLLEGIVADPGRSIDDLPLLSAAERHQLLVEWNDTQVAQDADQCLHRLFEARAARAPHAIALTDGSECLTYGELNRQANRLARHLRSRGVGPEVVVGLCVERSMETIVGLLGILKAGGAYLPLDPSYPVERLAFMLRDAGATVLVAQEPLLSRLPEGSLDVLRLDADRTLIDREGAENLDGGAAGENLAYVIYTSGSTGEPKGVGVAHRNVARLFASTERWFHFGERDVWTLFHSFTFDFSVWEIWGALLHGGRLVIIPHDVARSPDDFYRLLRRERVTVLNQTPSAFRQLMRSDERLYAAHAPADLRLVIFGGEALDPRVLRPWFDHHGDRRPQLVNMYGITETTVHVTYRPLTIADLEATGSPIGRPIPDLQVYLLDRRMQLVPVGVPGELYVGGAGVARGYLNRPELTARRFVPHPFDEGAGARLYSTGDLARYRANGELEYLGRVDDQVKIRGFRIELGEIEAALAHHPAVREALVLAHQDERGDGRLVAYIIPRQGQRVAADGLRDFLRERLPEYMLPALFVPIDTWPLTSNGKVDRHALPAPDAAVRAVTNVSMAPETPLQRQLVGLWEELLGVRPVGIKDDFFELGGHSLLAARLIDEIERSCGRRIPLATLFAEATVERLARVLAREDAADAASLMARVQVGGSARPFFFLHGDVEGGGFYCAKLARLLGPDQPFYALRPHGTEGDPIPPSVEAMATDYLSLVRSAQPEGPYLLGGFCNAGLVTFELARQLRAQGQAVDLVVVIDTLAIDRPLRLTRAVIRLLGRLVGRDRETLLDIFLWARYYDERWKGFWALSATTKARRMLGAVRGAVTGVARLCRGERTERAPDVSRRGGVLLSREELRRDVLGIHRWIGGGYVPRRYPGRIVSFVSEQARLEYSKDHTLGWRGIAREVDVHMIPGVHLTAIKEHVGVLATHLGAYLRAARADQAGQADR